MQHEPVDIEMLLTRLAFLICGRSVYKAFADRLPLDGEEHVLDFGCGMGTVAYYAAKRLTRGHLTCLDISARWLHACRKTLRKYGNVSFLLSGPDSPALAAYSFNVVYCHFVLHDVPASALKKVIPALAGTLRSGGVFVWREPLHKTEKLSLIKELAALSGLSLKQSRITDIPLMGNALESIYLKP